MVISRVSASYQGILRLEGTEESLNQRGHKRMSILGSGNSLGKSFVVTMGSLDESSKFAIIFFLDFSVPNFVMLATCIVLSAS